MTQTEMKHPNSRAPRPPRLGNVKIRVEGKEPVVLGFVDMLEEMFCIKFASSVLESHALKNHKYQILEIEVI